MKNLEMEKSLILLGLQKIVSTHLQWVLILSWLLFFAGLNFYLIGAVQRDRQIMFWSEMEERIVVYYGTEAWKFIHQQRKYFPDY